jgi:Na+-transporting NADH:ubiquinone oxidoreductase subunit NqrC
MNDTQKILFFLAGSALVSTVVATAQTVRLDHAKVKARKHESDSNLFQRAYLSAMKTMSHDQLLKHMEDFDFETKFTNITKDL